MHTADHLIDAISRGSVPQDDLEAFSGLLGRTNTASKALEAYRGSMDAALSVKAALIPDWGWSICAVTGSATVTPPGYPHNRDGLKSYMGDDPMPSRALLIATLRAA